MCQLRLFGAYPWNCVFAWVLCDREHGFQLGTSVVECLGSWTFLAISNRFLPFDWNQIHLVFEWSESTISEFLGIFNLLRDWVDELSFVNCRWSAIIMLFRSQSPFFGRWHGGSPVFSVKHSWLSVLAWHIGDYFHDARWLSESERLALSVCWLVLFSLLVHGVVLVDAWRVETFKIDFELREIWLFRFISHWIARSCTAHRAVKTFRKSIIPWTCSIDIVWYRLDLLGRENWTSSTIWVEILRWLHLTVLLVGSEATIINILLIQRAMWFLFAIRCNLRTGHIWSVIQRIISPSIRPRVSVLFHYPFVNALCSLPSFFADHSLTLDPRLLSIAQDTSLIHTLHGYESVLIFVNLSNGIVINGFIHGSSRIWGLVLMCLWAHCSRNRPSIAHSVCGDSACLTLLLSFLHFQSFFILAVII